MNSKKLVLNVVADVKQAKEGLGEVSQGIKDLFKLQQGSGRDIASGALKAFDGLRGALQGVMPVANAVLDIAQKGIEMAQFAGQRQILLRQVGTDNLEILRAATQGLVDDQTLLQAAAKGLRGDFAMTTQEMQDAAQAAIFLSSQGLGSVSDILQEINEKLATGEVEGLKKYGINLAMASTQAEKLGRAHEEMARLAGQSNGNLTNSGTQVSKMLVTLKNLWDELKVELGMVVDVIATVVNGFVDVTSAVGDAIGKFGAWLLVGSDLTDVNNEVYTSVRGVTNATMEAEEAERKHAASVAIAIDFAHRLSAEYDRVTESLRLLAGSETELEARRRRFAQMAELNKLGAQADEIAAEKAKEAAKKARELEKKDWEDFTKSLDKVMDHRLEIIQKAADAEIATLDRVRKFYEDNADIVSAKKLEMQRALLPVANENKVDPGIARLQAMARASMDAKRAMESLKASGVEAFGSLTNAAGTSLQAIISGNKAAQAGLSEVFKQLLDQLGTEMQINALKYLAMGTAAVFLDPAAAAGYFAASGIFEAAALAAGVAERAVGAPAGAGAGVGGGSSSGPANDNTAGRDAGSSSGGGNVTVVHNYYVNGFIGDEARLAREMERRQRQAELSGQVRMQRAGARRG